MGYWFPRSERGLATSLFDAAAKFSNAVGVAFTAWLLVMFGWRGMFWSTAALSLVFFALFYVFYRNPSEDKRLTHAEKKYIEEGRRRARDAGRRAAARREPGLPDRAAQGVGADDRLRRVRLPVRVSADLAADVLADAPSG